MLFVFQLRMRNSGKFPSVLKILSSEKLLLGWNLNYSLENQPFILNNVNSHVLKLKNLFLFRKHFLRPDNTFLTNMNFELEINIWLRINIIYLSQSKVSLVQNNGKRVKIKNFSGMPNNKAFQWLKPVLFSKINFEIGKQ